MNCWMGVGHALKKWPSSLTDILTKPLGKRKFEKFRKVLLNHEV